MIATCSEGDAMTRYLSDTREFCAFVERRREQEMRRLPLPCRILRAALDGYLSELRLMLGAPI